MAKAVSWIALLICLTGGAVIWVTITKLTGVREAWDSVHYFMWGLPLMMLVAAIAGYLAPTKTWRWGIASIAPQVGLNSLSGASWNLLPFALVWLTVLSSICTIGAFLGALIRKRGEK
jgi:small-conductance mechanosensitive channel